jgi:hypothetical protein
MPEVLLKFSCVLPSKVPSVSWRECEVIRRPCGLSAKSPVCTEDSCDSSLVVCHLSSRSCSSCGGTDKGTVKPLARSTLPWWLSLQKRISSLLFRSGSLATPLSSLVRIPAALLDLLLSLTLLTARPISRGGGCRAISALDLAGIGGSSDLFAAAAIATASSPAIKMLGRVLRRRSATLGAAKGLLISRGLSFALLGNSTA